MNKQKKSKVIPIAVLISLCTLSLLGADYYSELKIADIQEEQKMEAINAKQSTALNAQLEATKPKVENYRQGNTVYLELLENKKRIRKLSSDVHLPKETKLNYALEHNILPTKDELLAYVNLQKKIYAENQEVKNLVQTIILGLEISEEEYWDVVVFNNAIYNVLEANIGNYYLTTHNKPASFGILDCSPLSTNALAQTPPVNQEDILEAKAFIDSL